MRRCDQARMPGRASRGRRVSLLLIFGLTLSNAACQAAPTACLPAPTWQFWLPLLGLCCYGYFRAIVGGRAVSYRYCSCSTQSEQSQVDARVWCRPSVATCHVCMQTPRRSLLFLSRLAHSFPDPLLLLLLLLLWLYVARPCQNDIVSHYKEIALECVQSGG